MLLMILTEKKLLKLFTEKNKKKTNQKEFKIEKVIKRKGNKLYAKWKEYNNLLNRWIDKKKHDKMSDYFQNQSLYEQMGKLN